MELPGSYWQARRAEPARSPESESTNRLGWTIAITCIALFAISWILPHLFGHHERSKPGRQQVTIEELAAADKESGIEVVSDEGEAGAESEAPVPEALLQEAPLAERRLLSAAPPLPRPTPSPEEGLERPQILDMNP